MKIICSLFLLTIVFIFPLAAQDAVACAAKLADAPALLNLKLKMSPVEAQRVFGKDLKISNKNKGEYTFFQNYIDKSPPGSLANVRALYLRFYDGSLYQIEVFYQNRDLKPTLEDFINSESARLNIPISAWKIENGIVRLKCSEFSLVTDDILNPRVELTDEIARAQVEEERRKAKE